VSNIGQTRAPGGFNHCVGFRYGNPVLNSTQLNGGLLVRDDVLANQKHILETKGHPGQPGCNQRQPARHQGHQKIIVENQAPSREQESLDVILKNQHEILALLKK